MKILIEWSGYVLIFLALLHTIFPRYFHWKKDTASCALLTRQVLYVHTFFIALTVFLMGLLCITSASDLLNTPLGKRVALGLAFFWLCRLLIQFFGYSPQLWRGKFLETIIHVLFAILWTWLSALFLLTAFM